MTSLRRKEAQSAYLFILPAAIGLILFMLLPMFRAFQISFLDYSLLQPANSQSAGFANYAAIWEDRLFLRSLVNTGLYTVMVVGIQTALAVGLALLVNKKIPGLGFFRTAYFLPTVTSLVVVSTVWKLIYNSNGLLNSLLRSIGLSSQPFLLSATQALPSLALMAVWKSVGFSMLVILSGLQSIPEDIYDSAKVDGAGSLRTFFSITLPLLKRTLLFVVVITTISSLKVFAQVYLMTGGGPENSTMVILFHIFRTAFRYFDMGYASAMSFVFLLIVLGITLVQFRLFRSDVEY